MKKAFVAFLGNPFFDTRITNLIDSLEQNGIHVTVIGFEWIHSRVKSGKNVTVFAIKRDSPFGFYFSFIKILYKQLVNHTADYFFAEDIYTLPLLSLFAKSRKRKLFYNSRELYPYVAGLKNKKLIQYLLAKVERIFIKYPEKVFVTGEMDAEFLRQYYKISNIIVLRNLPKFLVIKEKADLRKMFSIREEDKIILYQGVVFNGRGIQLIIDALVNIENAHFIILGDGNQKEHFRNYADKSGLSNRVHFAGSVSQEKLSTYTSAADLGVALIENLTTSYYYALPGKLFEYIMSEIPVLCSDLPQMKKIVKEYNVGEAIPIESQEIITESLRRMLKSSNALSTYKENCKLAKKQLNWETEFQKLLPSL